MNYRIVLLGVLLLMSLNLKAAKSKDQKPNFIFILTDDHRYDLLGCSGHEILKTPNIDKLAEDGIQFTNAHVTSAICTPSRVSILLSQFERKHGVNFNSGTSVSPEAWAESYPVIMRDNGYYTGYVGKNHSPIGEGGYGSDLMKKSFDYWYAGHGHLSFYPKKRHEIFKGAQNDTQVELLEEGVDDFLDSNEHRLDGAVHFLDARPKDQPFLLNLCFNLPHGASTGTMKLLDTDPEIYKSLFRDIEIPMPENYIAKEDIIDPKIPLSVHRVSDRQTGYDYVDNPKDNGERYLRNMQAVTGIDLLVGRLRHRLKELKLDKNTIIIFSSDHGIFFGEYGLGGKALCYELTTHVPMIVYNPMSKKSNRGRVLNSLVQSIDVGPTMLSYAGIEIPKAFQGRDMKPIIEGETLDTREYVFTENLWSTQFGNPRCESIQDKEWKYVRYYKNETMSAQIKIKAAKELGLNVNRLLYSVHDPEMAQYRHFVEAPIKGEEPVFEELFNLKNDPLEANNVVTDKANAQVLKRLKKAWKEAIVEARGKGKPKVCRYTNDSMLENNHVVVHE